MLKEKLNILYIGGRVFPTPTANAINSINVINELINRGHNVTYIAINQDEKFTEQLLEGVEVYNIENSTFGRLLNKSKEYNINKKEQVMLLFHTVLRKIKNLFNILKYPDVEPKQSNKVYKLAKKLHNSKKFDVIIGVFRPFSGVSATIKMKKAYPDILAVAYYLDLLRGSAKPFLMPEFLYNYLSKYGEIKKLSKLDQVLIPKKGIDIYSEGPYKPLLKKITYVDFPVFKIYENHSKKSVFENEKGLNFVYAGTLNKEYRNPEPLLKIFEALSYQIDNFTLHIYGRGNCDSIINEYAIKFNIKLHGMVSHNAILQATNDADFLVNISNKMDNMVPSKIFELFATGKPIINLVSNRNDASIEYFKKYPSVCFVNEWNEFNDNLQSLISFIKKERNKKYDLMKIKDSYIENTPEFIVDLLEKKIYKTIYNFRGK